MAPLYADVRAYCSRVKMYCKRARLLSSHPRLSLSLSLSLHAQEGIWSQFVSLFYFFIGLICNFNPEQMCARFTPFLHGVIHYFCCDCSRLQSSAFTSFPGGFPFRKWNKPLGTNLLFLRSAAVFFILNVKKSREYVTRVATLICNLTRTFLEFNETFTKIRFNHNRCYLLHMR